MDDKHPLPNEDQIACRIWEAGRATSAAPTYFQSISFGTPAVEYWDGGMGCNNPTHEALIETSRIWGERRIACLLSIGTGLDVPPPITIPRFGLRRVRYLIAVASELKKIVTDCEGIHELVQEMCKYRTLPIPYTRLNVPNLGIFGMDEYKYKSDIRDATSTYLADTRTGEKIEQACKDIAERLMT